MKNENLVYIFLAAVGGDNYHIPKQRFEKYCEAMEYLYNVAFERLQHIEHYRPAYIAT